LAQLMTNRYNQDVNDDEPSNLDIELDNFRQASCVMSCALCWSPHHR